MKRYLFLLPVFAIFLLFFFFHLWNAKADVYDGVYGTCYFNDYGYQPQGIACAPIGSGGSSCAANNGVCYFDNVDPSCAAQGGYVGGGEESNDCVYQYYQAAGGGNFPWWGPLLRNDPTHCCILPSCTGDMGGVCPRLGHGCANGWTYDYSGNAADSACDSNNTDPICCIRIQECNVNSVQSGGCDTSGYAGTNTCGTINSTIEHTYTKYKNCNFGFTCQASSTCNQVVGDAGSSSCQVFHDDCTGGAGYVCHNGNTCTTSIFVHVHTDWNHSGTNGSGDTDRNGVPINDGGGNTINTSGTGDTTFTNKGMGNYTITMTTPANFQVTGSTAKNNGGGNNNTHGAPSNVTTFNLGTNNGNEDINYYVTPLYSISGQVFKDVNKNQQYDGGDSGYGGGTIHITGPTVVADITAAGDGTWTTPTNLESGNYTVTYTTSLAAGYTFTTPSSFVVTVGDPAGSPDCAVGGSLDAKCTDIANGDPTTGSIKQLDIGLTDENSWKQSVCFDVRDDSGSYTDLIPAAPSCGGVSGSYNSITNADCSTGAGIIFTCDATPDFGLGSANANDWQAGGATTDAECYSGPGLNVVRTSYDYLTTTMREAGITPVDMSTVCTLSGCTLPPDLKKGLYAAEGDVHLNAFTFPVDPSIPQGFIFLIHGDLYIDGNIIVPAGSVAAFSTSGNIIVNKEVGNVITDPNDVANNNPNIEGLYSADASFTIESKGDGITNICNADGTPLDKKLNIVGSVITNAAKAGGSLQNNRDMCLYDLECSSLSLGDGTGTDDGLAMSYLLTLFADGKFLSHKVFNWQELRP